MEEKSKIILVIPVYNEQKNIKKVIEGAKKYVQNIVVVDDCSTDNTYQSIKNSGAVILRHKINLGKADALKTGCIAALRSKADVIIIMDGDGQHSPEDLPLFLKAIQGEQIDVVFGSRKERSQIPLLRRLGTTITDLLMKNLFGINISDVQCGYRAFTKEAYEKLKWKSHSYLADAEITARVGKYKLRYKEATIQTIYYDVYKGMNIIDGLKVLTNILIWRITL